MSLIRLKPATCLKNNKATKLKAKKATKEGEGCKNMYQPATLEQTNFKVQYIIKDTLLKINVTT